MKMKTSRIAIAGSLMGVWISGCLVFGQGINVSRGRQSDFKFPTSPASRFAVSPTSPFALGQSSFFGPGSPESNGRLKRGLFFRPHSFLFGNLSLNQ